ncbi:MAG: Gfo/Idh/MocA family oxidoreductase [Clostridia bacterium]|nr:Gfo/Idh/MocA family oxidoreductase [Clostridia bacterium]
MIKTAIAGCGGIAQVHAAILNGINNVELCSFCDIITERAESMAEKYGGKVYTSIEDMLNSEKIDVLHICLPHYLHVPVAVSALKKEIKVFMEKPPCISPEQLKELYEVQTDKTLALCFQNRYNACVQYAKKLIDSGESGRVKGCRGYVTWHREAPYYTESGWRGKLDTEGGGALINQSVHTLDLMTYLTGKPVRAEASIQNHHLKGVIEVEDMMEAYIEYEGGAVGSFYATTAYHTDEIPIIEIDCENMKLRLEDPELTIYYPDGRREKPELEVNKALGKSYWGASHGICIESFYKALEEGRSFDTCLDKVMDTARLMLTCYDSARNGGMKNLQEI